MKDKMEMRPIEYRVTPDPKMPKICMVTHHDCIRVFKESHPLIEKGYALGLFTNQLGSGWNMFNPACCYLDENQFKTSLTYLVNHSDFQIYHVHNEPDWIARITCEIVQPKGKKVVWDIHDIESARSIGLPFDEVQTIEKVDGIVHVSFKAKDWVNKWYKSVTPHQVVLPSMVPKEYMRLRKLAPYRIKNSIVYEGGLTPPKSAEPKKEKVGRQVTYTFEMRDYSKAMFALSNEGFKPYIMQSGGGIGTIGDVAKMYRQYGVTALPSVSPIDLPSALSSYEWGLVGFPLTFNLGDMAMPNKLWEYLAGETVPIVINCQSAGEFVEKNDIGIWVKSEKDFYREGYLRQILHPDNFKNNGYYRTKIKAMLPNLVMESNIHYLEEMYSMLLGKTPERLGG